MPPSKGQYFVKHTSMDTTVSHHATFPDIFSPSLKLRFNERDDVRLRHEPPFNHRQKQTERNEGSVNHHEINWLSQTLEITGIGALNHDDTRILTKRIGNLTVANVYCVDT